MASTPTSKASTWCHGVEAVGIGGRAFWQTGNIGWDVLATKLGIAKKIPAKHIRSDHGQIGSSKRVPEP